MTTLFIRDDLGHVWYYEDGYNTFEGGKIKCVLSDMDERVPKGYNGYDCESLEDGIRLLNEYGYITGTEYDDDDVADPDLDYFIRGDS